MNLKEAFRYQNFLVELLNETRSHLSQRANITKIEQHHLRKKVNSEAEDEVIDTSKERTITIKPDIIVKFMISLLEERCRLSEAITEAKATCGLDIDSAVSMNVKRHEVIRVLNFMNGIKDGKRIISGRANKFNVEGNQVPYIYDVEEETKLDFDKSYVRERMKELHSECDKISAQIDKIMVDTEVDYEGPYDVNDNFEDVLTQFATKA